MTKVSTVLGATIELICKSSASPATHVRRPASATTQLDSVLPEGRAVEISRTDSAFTASRVFVKNRRFSTISI